MSEALVQCPMERLSWIELSLKYFLFLEERVVVQVGCKDG